MFMTFVLPTLQQVTLVLHRKIYYSWSERIFLSGTHVIHKSWCTMHFPREDSFVFTRIWNHKIILWRTQEWNNIYMALAIQRI